MGICKCLLYSIRNFLICFFVIVLMPGLPPKTHFDFEAHTIAKPRELKGALELNTLLNNGERLFENQLSGPECLIARGNEIYVSTHGGEILKITDNHITHVTKFGKPCEGAYEESICGRPLGFAFDTVNPNTLIAADAYYGLWKVDLTTGKKQLLVSPQRELDGKVIRSAKVFNSVAISKSGDIYWTDSTSDFVVENGFQSMFANPSGRLFKYDRVKNENKMLIDELYFANGVALHPTEDFVVVAETGALRLRRYYLKGPLAGTSDMFIDGLPGLPDNLTPDADGIWVPLVWASDDENPSIWSSAARAPLIRKFFIRVIDLIELPFKLVHSVYPNAFTKKMINRIGHFEQIGFLIPKRTSIVRVDWNGNIVGSLHGDDKSIGGIVHVLEHNDYLYLGSYANKYIGRVKLPKVPGKKQESETVKAVPTTTTPTTTTTTSTTPKPTTTTTTKAPSTTSTTPTTTTTTTTTTAKPKTTEAPKPKPTAAPTPKPAEPPKTQIPPVTTEKPKEPAPIHEHDTKDTKPPPPEKLKVIKKDGGHIEL